MLGIFTATVKYFTDTYSTIDCVQEFLYSQTSNIMEQKTILLNNRSLRYNVEGKGRAVVLIHGFGETGSVWDEQVSGLAGYHLIIPDLPGSGGSELQEDVSMEGLAESIRSILGAEGVEKAVVIGHSMGGYVTLAFAERYPELMYGFGLFHSTAFADTEEKTATRRKGIDFINRNGASAFLKTTLPNYFAEGTKQSRPVLIEQQIKVAAGFTDASLIAYYESMIKRPDRTNVLRESKVPVLIILGMHDTAVPLEDGLKQVHLADTTDFHLLERSGHMGMLEEKEKANQAIHHYLQIVF